MKKKVSEDILLGTGQFHGSWVSQVRILSSKWPLT